VNYNSHPPCSCQKGKKFPHPRKIFISSIITM
jgi:hypothetical protein